MFLKAIQWHRLLNDEPGDEAPAAAFDPRDAFEKATDAALKDIDTTFHAEPAVKDEPAVDTDSAGAPPRTEPVGAEVDSLPSAPATPPPDQSFWEAQRQQAQAIQQLAEMQRRQLEASQPKPQPAAPPDYTADWKAPRPDPNLSEDENTARYLASLVNHVGVKAREAAVAEYETRFQSQLAPLQQHIQQQQREAQWNLYLGHLDDAVATAGYARGTPAFDAVRNAIHGQAIGAVQARQAVTPESLRAAATSFARAFPPVRGPQQVTQQTVTPDDTPLTGTAPAGSRAPSSPPSGRIQRHTSMADADAAFNEHAKRILGG